jgi:hypothetical protein
LVASTGALLGPLFVAVSIAPEHGGEIILGAQLLGTSNPDAFLTTLLELLLAVFAIGLVRAWELLGAPSSRGLFGRSVEWAEGKLGRKPPASGRE